MSARIIALPYRNFKQKIRITKKFERIYHIEDLSMDSTVGILYMERREESEQSCINRKIN